MLRLILVGSKYRTNEPCLYREAGRTCLSYLLTRSISVYLLRDKPLIKLEDSLCFQQLISCILTLMAWTGLVLPMTSDLKNNLLKDHNVTCFVNISLRDSSHVTSCPLYHKWHTQFSKMLWLCNSTPGKTNKQTKTQHNYVTHYFPSGALLCNITLLILKSIRCSSLFSLPLFTYAVT